MPRKFLLLVSLLAGMAGAAADEFPAKEITFIVPFGAGGPSDITARELAGEIFALTRQRLVVLNRPGASATIGTSEVFRAKPDGYTILLADNLSTALQPHVVQVDYRGPEDFQPVIKLAENANVLVVNADAKWKNLDEFVADARAHPGRLSVSTSGRLTGNDLNVVEFNRVAGIDTTTVPLTGGGASLNLLLGKHVDAASVSTGTAIGQVQSGKIRALVLFSPRRNPALPEVASTVELGYRTTMNTILFISAPKNTDREVVGKLHDMFAGALKSPRFQESARRNGFFLDPKGPEELGKELREWQQFFARYARENTDQMKK